MQNSVSNLLSSGKETLKYQNYISSSLKNRPLSSWIKELEMMLPKVQSKLAQHVKSEALFALAARKDLVPEAQNIIFERGSRPVRRILAKNHNLDKGTVGKLVALKDYMISVSLISNPVVTKQQKLDLVASFSYQDASSDEIDTFLHKVLLTEKSFTEEEFRQLTKPYFAKEWSLGFSLDLLSFASLPLSFFEKYYKHKEAYLYLVKNEGLSSDQHLKLLEEHGSEAAISLASTQVPLSEEVIHVMLEKVKDLRFNTMIYMLVRKHGDVLSETILDLILDEIVPETFYTHNKDFIRNSYEFNLLVEVLAFANTKKAEKIIDVLHEISSLNALVITNFPAASEKVIEDNLNLLHGRAEIFPVITYCKKIPSSKLEEFSLTQNYHQALASKSNLKLNENFSMSFVNYVIEREKLNIHENGSLSYLDMLIKAKEMFSEFETTIGKEELKAFKVFDLPFKEVVEIAKNV